MGMRISSQEPEQFRKIKRAEQAAEVVREALQGLYV
jgi:hypothetical protein